MKKQEILYVTIVFIGIFLLSYGLLGLPRLAFEFVVKFMSKEWSFIFVILKLVELLPLVVGYKMLYSPLMFYRFIDSSAEPQQIPEAEKLSSYIKKISGIVIMVVGAPILFESIIGYNNYKTFTELNLNPGAHDVNGLYHQMNMSIKFVWMLFGLVLYKNISLKKAFKETKN